MEVFLSWSQTRSETVARALHQWIPLVLQPVRPWLSRDIEKGARWDDVISRKLDACDFGVVCLTPESLHSDWLVFEAGALSKKVNEARVCTYLLDLKPSDITGPLAKFQHTTATREDTYILLDTLNVALGEQGLDSDRFRRTFEQWWPDLEQRLATARALTVTLPSTSRGTEDKIDEILLTVRTLDTRLQRIARPQQSPQPETEQREDVLRLLLREADWNDLTPRLLAYAASRLGREDAGMRGITSAETYVHSAVSEVLTGRHELPADPDVSLFGFLAAIIDALMERDRLTGPGPDTAV
jgi:hypothetical protein